MVTNYLPHLAFDNDTLPIKDTFLDKQLFTVKIPPWYTDIVNFLIASEMPH